MINMNRTIYFLPGHGGRISNGLGQALLQRGFYVVGRETIGEFKSLDFDDQVATVASDLKSSFWHDDALVLANSFGAYLLLHALSYMQPFPGKILLLSPIVGEFSRDAINMGFIPPYSKRLYETASMRCYPIPKQCEIHVGSEDWQSNPENVAKFASLLGISFSVVQGDGHRLTHDYVSKTLEKWLAI
jgi:hypothetical protein